jgi:hypothetical protein
MRKEVFDKLYQITEKELKTKADVGAVEKLDEKLEEKFENYERKINRYKSEMIMSIKNLSKRVEKQGLQERAKSPMPDIDTSAILSKRVAQGFKWANCDKNLGLMEGMHMDYSNWNHLPKRKEKNRMLHLGNGYSRMLKSLNQDIFSPDNSLNNEEGSDFDGLPLSYENRSKQVLPTYKKSTDRELDPNSLDISCQKLPHIRSTSQIHK